MITHGTSRSVTKIKLGGPVRTLQSIQVDKTPTGINRTFCDLSFFSRDHSGVVGLGELILVFHAVRAVWENVRIKFQIFEDPI